MLHIISTGSYNFYIEENLVLNDFTLILNYFINDWLQQHQKKRKTQNNQIFWEKLYPKIDKLIYF